MKKELQSKTNYLLRFDRGEEVLSMLKDFCEDNDIQAASFIGIGAGNNLVLSFYDPAIKGYRDKTFDENFEIASLTGNVSMDQDAVMIHCHGVFGLHDYTCISGHVKAVTITATCEIALKVLDGIIERELNSEVNLKLMK